MNIYQKVPFGSVALSVGLVIMLAGCEPTSQSGDPVADQSASQSAEDRLARRQTARDQGYQDQSAADPAAMNDEPMGKVMEFDGYTLRANVSRTDMMNEATARQYGIEPAANLVLLNLVVLDKRSSQQPVPVAAEVRAQHESLSGHFENIAMREVESNGFISYIGTLDSGAERFFQLAIEAQPEGVEQAFQMSFEVRLDRFESGGGD